MKKKTPKGIMTSAPRQDTDYTKVFSCEVEGCKKPKVAQLMSHEVIKEGKSTGRFIWACYNCHYKQ